MWSTKLQKKLTVREEIYNESLRLDQGSNLGRLARQGPGGEVLTTVTLAESNTYRLPTALTKNKEIMRNFE